MTKWARQKDTESGLQVCVHGSESLPAEYPHLLLFCLSRIVPSHMPSMFRTCVWFSPSPLGQLWNFNPGTSEESFAEGRCEGLPCFERKVSKKIILPKPRSRKKTNFMGLDDQEVRFASVRVLKDSLGSFELSLN